MIKKTTVRQPVTLTQVAEAAGVSIATVSRVLNRRGQVDEQTKLRVLDTVDELGYDASSIARKAAAISQADNKLYRVELLLCPLAEQKNMLMLDYFDEMLRGIQSYFSRHGNMMMNICTWDPASYSEENDQIFNRLLSADGIIVIGNPTCDVVDRLVASRMKPVLISSDRDDISINSVESD
ncbi:LacI family DNA-binding transcriptional regulator, partial [Victivallis vadensis]|uniref:LacI family DNA-binding transcriptional regulator n=1 Tax=Victivallis vadensis TaxID=172901 RepID=UPI003AF73326